MADDELFYTNFGIDQAGDIVGRLMSACVCGPLDPDDACLPCCARTEIERLRAEVADDIVTRLRQEHVVGWIHPAGECVTCDAADEIKRLRAVLDAERALADQLAVALLGTASGRIIPTDDEWAGVVKMRSAALDAWEARRG